MPDPPPDEKDEAPIKALDEDDIALLTAYGAGPYAAKLKAAEAELEKLVAQRNAIDQAMFDPKSAAPALTSLTMTELMKRRAELDGRVAAAEAAWLHASETIEAITADEAGA